MGVFFFPVVITNQQDILPIGIDSYIARKAQGIQNGYPVALYRKDRRPVHFSQDGYAEVGYLYVHQRLFDIGLQLLLHHPGQFLLRQACHFQTPQHREINVAVRIHQIGVHRRGGYGRLLSRPCIGINRGIERGSYRRVGSRNGYRQLVIRADSGFVTPVHHLFLFRRQRIQALQIGYIFRHRARACRHDD